MLTNQTNYRYTYSVVVKVVLLASDIAQRLIEPHDYHIVNGQLLFLSSTNNYVSCVFKKKEILVLQLLKQNFLS